MKNLTPQRSSKSCCETPKASEQTSSHIAVAETEAQCCAKRSRSIAGCHD